MTTPSIEIVDLTQLVGSLETPCDWSDADYCAKKPAEWGAHAMCPACGGSQWYLICTPCKDLVLLSEDAFECARCGEVVAPARKFVAQFERLEKR